MHLSAVLFPLLLLLPQSAQRDGWLGVYLAQSDRAEVAEVIPGSPAAKADLRVGDRFLAVGDKKTANPVEFVEAIAGHKAGDRVVLAIRRGDETLRVEVELAKRPPDDQIPPMGQRPAERPPEPPPAPGVAPKVPATGKAFIGVGLRETNAGLEITRVVDDSPAAKARLRVGDRLMRVDDEPVKNLEQLGELLAQHRPGDKLALEVRGDAGVTLAMIVLGAMPSGGAEVAPVTPVTPVTPPAKDLDAALDRAQKKLRELEAELEKLKKHAKALDELEALGAEVRALRKLLEDLRSGR